MMPSDQRFVSCRAAFLIHVWKSWEYFATISKSALFGMYVEGFSWKFLIPKNTIDIS